MEKEPPDIPIGAYISAIIRMLGALTDIAAVRKIYYFVLSLYL